MIVIILALSIDTERYKLELKTRKELANMHQSKTLAQDTIIQNTAMTGQFTNELNSNGQIFYSHTSPGVAVLLTSFPVAFSQEISSSVKLQLYYFINILRGPRAQGIFYDSTKQRILVFMGFAPRMLGRHFPTQPHRLRCALQDWVGQLTYINTHEYE